MKKAIIGLTAVAMIATMTAGFVSAEEVSSAVAAADMAVPGTVSCGPLRAAP